MNSSEVVNNSDSSINLDNQTSTISHSRTESLVSSTSPSRPSTSLTGLNVQDDSKHLASNGSSDLTKRYIQTFKLWEGKNKGHIEAKNLGNVLRALLKNPSERQLKEFLSEVELVNDELISFDQFMTIANRCDIPEIDYKESLLRCFEVYDPEQRGYIRVSQLKTVLLTQGDPDDLSMEEFDEMVHLFAETIPKIPNLAREQRSDEEPKTNEDDHNVATSSDMIKSEPVIFYGKFINSCLSNINIHERNVVKKRRTRSQSPKKR